MQTHEAGKTMHDRIKTSRPKISDEEREGNEIPLLAYFAYRVVSWSYSSETNATPRGG